MKILPYNKLEKTKESRDFFFSHIGYFNFWDDLLILRTKEDADVFLVLVDRGDYRKKYEWGSHRANDKQKSSFVNAIATSVYYKKPEEMFEDFPELISKFSTLYLRKMIADSESCGDVLKEWWNKTFGQKK